MMTPEQPVNDAFVIVSTTLPSQASAQQIARMLVERQLAACVHVLGPIHSVYRWQGVVESADEWTCQVKTRRAWFDRVCDVVKTAHPYEVPEIIATRIECVSADYLDWLDQQL